jgi:hypothetical protein
MRTIRDFWARARCARSRPRQRRAIAKERQRWLPILAACVERDEDVNEHVHGEIRRLRRLLGLPPADPSPAVMERRRQQVRDRVRRFRERRGIHG